VSDRATLATATDADREMNRWFGPQFVAERFAFTSIAVVTTLIMIALTRRRELGLMRLVGATPRQIRSMARWEAILIIIIGRGIGLAISATALLPLSHARNGGLPYAPTGVLAAIVGVTTLLALRRGRTPVKAHDPSSARTST
jgi:putative ABC transport system permease protein